MSENWIIEERVPMPPCPDETRPVDSLRDIEVDRLLDDAIDDDLGFGGGRVDDWTTRLVANLNARFPATDRVELQISQLKDLEQWGMPTVIAGRLRDVVAGDATEAQVVLAALLVLIEGDVLGNASRHLARLVRKAAKAQPIPQSLVTRVRSALSV